MLDLSQLIREVNPDININSNPTLRDNNLALKECKPETHLVTYTIAYLIDKDNIEESLSKVTPEMIDIYYKWFNQPLGNKEEIIDSLVTEEDINKITLTLPISQKEIKLSTLDLSKETVKEVRRIREEYPLNIFVEEVLASNWLEGGVEELMDLHSLDALYLFRFMAAYIDRFGLGRYLLNKEQ